MLQCAGATVKIKIAILNTTPATRFGRILLLIIFGVFDQRMNFKFVTKVALSCTFAIGVSDIAGFTLDTLGARGKRTICALFRLVGVTAQQRRPQFPVRRLSSACEGPRANPSRRNTGSCICLFTLLAGSGTSWAGGLSSSWTAEKEKELRRNNR